MAVGVDVPVVTGAEMTTVATPAKGQTRAAVRGATPLAIAGILANGANVLVTLVIARQLTTAQYGVWNQLIAIFFVVSMPGSALVVGVVRRITAWEQTSQRDRIAGWARRVRRIAVVAVLAVLIVSALLRVPLADALSLPGPSGIAEVLTAGAAWCLLCVDRGMMQSAHSYSALAGNLLVEGGLRSFLTVGFVVAGAGPGGAAAALLLGILAADVHARWSISRRGLLSPGADLSPGSALGPAVDSPYPPEEAMVPPAVAAAGRRSLAADVATALGALGMLGLLQNLDVIVLGQQAPANAGSYAAISVSSKALVFAAMVLASFLLPEAASRKQLGQHALHQLGGTLALLAIPATLLVGLAAIAPDKLLTLAFGSRLSGASDALLPLSVAMTCLGCTVLFTHYLLAVARRRILVALAIAVAAAIPMLINANGEPLATAQADLIVQGALAVVSGLLVLQVARRLAGPPSTSRTSSTRTGQEAVAS
jgi:O-antigen/teichoic acid export membrane protein